jgi:membrane fusion protein (multidrug efflux system)
MLVFMPLAVILLVLILGFPFGLLLTGSQQQPPAPTVSTLVVRAAAWQPTVEVVGSLSASRGADLAFEVPGVVEQVFFESGGQVRAGQELVRLRSQDDAARLRTLQASAELARTNFARGERLWEIQGISKAELDTFAATLRSAQAQVAEQQAIVGKKVLRAPFAGRLGIRQVNVGQYVTPGAVVATLQVLDPIKFDFSVPQQLLGQLRVGQALAVRIDSFPNAEFAGVIETIDPKVDPATRNIAVRASLTNTDGQLLPGMYATAEIETGATQNHLTVPQTAVTFNPYGNTVFKVEEQTANGEKSLVARQVFVTTGETRGDQVAILSGINQGDTIVSAGQFKLQNGQAITVNNTVQPSNDPNAAPVDR